MYFAVRKKRALWGGYPRFKNSLNSIDRNTAASDKNTMPSVLVATSVGGHLAAATMEGLISVALKRRGANVSAYLCDGVLSACMDCEHRRFALEFLQEQLIMRGPGALCIDCFAPAKKMYDSAAIHSIRYGENIELLDIENISKITNEIKIEDIRDFKYCDASVGEHAYAGALRFFARADLEGEKFGEGILRTYLKAAMIAAVSIQNLLNKKHFDVVVLNHGIYVPQGVIAEVSKNRGVRVVTWNPSYRAKTFVFSHDTTYHHTLMSEPISTWENLTLTKQIYQKITSYLDGRRHGLSDWIWFHRQPNFAIQEYAKCKKIDLNCTTVLMLTNVAWDAQLHYPANAFSNMFEWVKTTISYFESRKDLQLIIRIHPAEINSSVPSRQRTEDEIKRNFPQLPDNIIVVGANDPISTYSLIEIAKTALIYGTKTGVEITALGIPVIVAGEAWIRGKGLTVDVRSEREYLDALNQLPLPPLSHDTKERALKYAYHFFFRRMIPLSMVEKKKGWPPYFLNVDSLDSLDDGKDLGLDVICNGILHGAPFVFPDETV